MNLQSQIIIFNLLFIETIAYYLSVSQSTPTITKSNQTISQFNSTFKFNTTLQIEGESFKYLIVEFQQTSKSKSKVAVLFNEKFPTFEINNTLQFQYMDYDSYALKKQNHYLVIQNMFFPKFITILSNISITFDLILTGTNITNCLNNCSNNGKCIQGSCFCISNFIGKDCSFKATELEIQTWSNQTLSNYVTFFYYQQKEKSKELDLIFYTDSQKNLTILEIVSSFISLPTLRFYDFQGKFNKSIPLTQIISSKGFKDFDEDDILQEDTDNDNEDIFKGTFASLNNLPTRLIIAVLCESLNTSLSIQFQQRQLLRNKPDLLEYLLPTGVVITIIVIVVLLIWNGYKKRKKFENQLTLVQSESDCAICLLCQTNLQNQKNKIVTLKVCQQNHNFHKKCLFQFYKKEPKQISCPICPQIILVTNTIS